MRYLLLILLAFTLLFAVSQPQVYAQRSPFTSAPTAAPVSDEIGDPTSAAKLEEKKAAKKEDVTRPEQETEKKAYLELFKNRPVEHLSILNAIAYGVQYAFKAGVPANTIILILLLPFLASIVAAVRHIIGLPSLGMLVPIALSITLLETGVWAGSVLLFAILFGSVVARLMLKKLRIMQLPKLALSMLVVSVFILVALTASAAGGLLAVRTLSIFPILLFILLSDRIVALLLERTMGETVRITFITLVLSLLGFFLLSFQPILRFVLLYPEIVLILIPLNIIIGRYFGLRVTEYVRFTPLKRHGSN